MAREWRDAAVVLAGSWVSDFTNPECKRMVEPDINSRTSRKFIEQFHKYWTTLETVELVRRLGMFQPVMKDGVEALPDSPRPEDARLPMLLPIQARRACESPVQRRGGDGRRPVHGVQ